MPRNAFALSTVLLAAVAVAQPPQYTLTVIDPSGTRAGRDISPAGVVCGENFSGAPNHAFVWRGGVMQSFVPPQPSGIMGLGVNDAEVVVGFVENQSIGTSPFFGQGGNIQMFSPLGGDYGVGNDVNNAGVVVGTANSSTYAVPVPFRWQSGIGEPLPLLPGDTTGFASRISEFGVIVGTSEGAAGRRPVVWSDGLANQLPLPAGFVQGQATCIGANGWIGGFARSGNDADPLLWIDGAVTRLDDQGAQYAYVHGATADGLVLGTLDDPSHPSRNAVLWANGQLFDLHELIVGTTVGMIYNARGFDAQGRILASATVGGVNALVLLSPIPAPPTAVALVGALMILRRRRS